MGADEGRRLGLQGAAIKVPAIGPIQIPLVPNNPTPNVIRIKRDQFLEGRTVVEGNAFVIKIVERVVLIDVGELKHGEHVFIQPQHTHNKEIPIWLNRCELTRWRQMPCNRAVGSPAYPRRQLLRPIKPLHYGSTISAEINSTTRVVEFHARNERPRLDVSPVGRK